MERTYMNLGNDDGKEENTVQYAIENLEFRGGTFVPKRCRRKLEPGKTLMLNIRRSRANASWRELFLRNIHGFHNSIPKHITTSDEKYVFCCLELIHNYSLRVAAQNFFSKVDVLADDWRNLAEIKNLSSNNITGLAIECPLDGGAEVMMNSTGDWTIATVSGNQSVVNILKSPLLQQFGSVDCEVNFRRTELPDVSDQFYSDSAEFPEKSGSTLSCKVQKGLNFVDHTSVSAPVHKRDAPVSSINFTSSDQSSSPASGTSFQGMLHCMWTNGLPHHVFTVDDKEVYVANLSKVWSSDDKDLDYAYNFSTKRNGKKECDIHECELENVAKMQVSTSITFSSDNLKVRETRYILSVCSGDHTGEMQISKNALRKNKKLTRKVVDVFKSSHSPRQRSASKLGGSIVNSEDTPRDPPDDVHHICLDQGNECVENEHAPNFELAAIIMKEIYNKPKEAELGGWGLKFLKKPEMNASPEASIHSECSWKPRQCSTITDILIPAGFHGGPRTRTGGPSSLIERWISGGGCNCGGWDIGCPLTILKSRSSSADHSSSDSEECKSIDLFVQGSKQNAHIMKMVNVHDGLYYIHFQSTLSTLQSFAIATAVIHSQSPVLQPKEHWS